VRTILFLLAICGLTSLPSFAESRHECTVTQRSADLDSTCPKSDPDSGWPSGFRCYAYYNWDQNSMKTMYGACTDDVSSCWDGHSNAVDPCP